MVRSSGAEPARTDILQFRVHQHRNKPGEPPWVAVDFLNPAVSQWVSEIAGWDAPIPPDVAT